MIKNMSYILIFIFVFLSFDQNKVKEDELSGTGGASTNNVLDSGITVDFEDGDTCDGPTCSSSVTFENVTFSSLGSTNIRLINVRAGTYNMTGTYMDNRYQRNFPDFKIEFSEPVKAFGFTFGSVFGLNTYTLKAYDTNSNLLETITIESPAFSGSRSSSANNYEYTGISRDTADISYVNVESTSSGSWFMWDNFIYVSGSTSQLHTEWVQPYAAMQNVGLKSIDNNRDLVLAKAGECNNYGWVIGDTDYCVYTNAKNKVSYVNGDTTRGSYGSAVFNGSINVEKTINDKWKAGIAYGMGSTNLYDFDFSETTANLDSSNNHYSFYGVKKVNDKFTLKGMVGGAVFDYKGKRNYSTTSATSAYESDGYTAEINGTWDIKKEIKNSKTPIRLKPTVGVAFAAHAQDGFSESGSGDLITVESNQAESLLFKTGIGIDKQITMQQGWLLVPSLALNYEMDTYAGNSTRDIKGKVTGSSDASTSVEAKTFGQHRGSVKLGADFVLSKDFMFNLNAEYGLATYGDENSYGGGFRWQF